MLGFNSGRHDYPDLHKKQEAVPVNVKKVLEIVKRQNYALGFRNLPV